LLFGNEREPQQSGFICLKKEKARKRSDPPLSPFRAQLVGHGDAPSGALAMKSPLNAFDLSVDAGVTLDPNHTRNRRN
jgi:hypothetical protein